MTKRRRPARAKPVRGNPLPAPRRIEVGPDGYDYEVRPIAAARAVKIYRCPGCDHEISPGTTHLLVWPADAGERGIDDRRHWHTPCWTHRANRRPTRRWS
ncbi:hypothetical protein JDV09_14865 [Mycobacterium sp. Y57]|uniref:hypothetical protein n=1 Tax=Mycolicibacterium xanthum TaxID=2796469 RepID=UPI001C861E76|nr:hypothetical protein [Mycolicibacterium xanthum]MBX7433383.1 hypothetical protein [Mycolicibacterium xanthum]